MASPGRSLGTPGGPQGPPALSSSYAPRRRFQKAVDGPTDNENPYMETLRKVEGAIDGSDQTTWNLLRAATQIPKASLGSDTLRAGLPPSTPTNVAGAARSAAAGIPGSPPSTSFAAGAAGSTGYTASSPSRGPPGKSDALASIYSRASDASIGQKAADSSLPPPPPIPDVYLPAEARLLPPSTRISELEDGACELLLTLLRQERKNVEILKAQAEQEAENSLSRSRRTPVEAELSFRRLTAQKSPFAVEKPAGVIEAELSSLATALLSMPSHGQRTATALPPSQLPAQVEALTAACQRHLSTVYRGDRNSARSLNAVRDMGQLLIEIERDTQAMALALAAGSGASTNRWAARLGSVSKTLRPTMPDLDSLSYLLEMENELMREALKRPPAAPPPLERR